MAHMLTSIRLQNFKGHRDTTVPLGRMTVLVGPNGAGKTSVLQAIHLLTRLVQEFHPTGRRYGPAALYNFDAHRIAAASYCTEETPTVCSDGSNVAAVLATLKLEREETFYQIESELRRFVPHLRRIRIRQARVEGQPGNIGHEVVFDLHHAPGIPAHGVGKGTLAILALLTALLSPTRPRLLLVDDISQSLHPEVQLQLVRELKRLLEHLPDIQLVATTHSPYILDELAPEDVHVFALRPEGGIASKRLSEHPRAARMKGALTAGQLWSLDPERHWVQEHDEVKGRILPLFTAAFTPPSSPR